MGRGRLGLALLGAMAVGLSGCGASGPRTPDLSRLPLVPGARIALQVRVCDTGANSYCGWEVVVVAPGYRDSDVLLTLERRHLKKLGWSAASGDIGSEHAADSPGHRLRLSYATPTQDLQGVDLGFIRRSRPVTLALSRAFFEHVPTLSMLLEVGAY